jgi:hypothetical protein
MCDVWRTIKSVSSVMDEENVVLLWSLRAFTFECMCLENRFCSGSGRRTPALKFAQNSFGFLGPPVDLVKSQRDISPLLSFLAEKKSSWCGGCRQDGAQAGAQWRWACCSKARRLFRLVALTVPQWCRCVLSGAQRAALLQRLQVLDGLCGKAKRTEICVCVARARANPPAKASLPACSC